MPSFDQLPYRRHRLFCSPCCLLLNKKSRRTNTSLAANTYASAFIEIHSLRWGGNNAYEKKVPLLFERYGAIWGKTAPIEKKRYCDPQIAFISLTILTHIKENMSSNLKIVFIVSYPPCSRSPFLHLLNRYYTLYPLRIT